MSKRSILCLAPFLAATLAAAQSPSASPAQDSQPSPTTTIYTQAKLVVLDVTVQDKDGHPIHGLKREDFTISENRKPQTVISFDEHTADSPVTPAPPMPPQPAGVFTDYTPIPPDGVLNVVLLDNLNTPTKDQSYVRSQLQKFVKNAPAGARIAIFGLTNRVYFLQGFTSNPEILKDAVEHKLTPRTSFLLDDPTGNNSDAISAGMPAGAIADNFTNFEAEQESFKTRVRVEYTLDAFNQLAHYLAAFPGRKNLIWFSASFPIDVAPDPTLPNPFTSMIDPMQEEYHQTTNLLAQAEVAVYPIDAQGIVSDPTFDVAKSGAGYTKNPRQFSNDENAFFTTQAEQHQTMFAIAQDTGGDAYLNSNDLATGVRRAIESGSNFYTLTYTPTDHTDNGEFRSIKVQLTHQASARGLSLSYRQGYFADQPFKPSSNPDKAAGNKLASADDRPTYNYDAAAMSRGAPMPADIFFRVRVLPASKTVEETVAPDNKPGTHAPFKPPYRRYDVDISASPEGFTFVQQANGRKTDTIEFSTFVYDNDGRLLNLTGKTISLDLSPDKYKQFKDSKIGYHLEVDAPARGESYLRIGIHNVPNDTFGVVEVPTSSVINLPPPVYPARK